MTLSPEPRGVGHPPAAVARAPQPIDPEDAFSVLADPTRWLLIRTLPARGEVSYATLRQALQLTKPSLTYHTRILARAGLIDVHKRGRRVSCSLRRDALRGLVGQLAYLAALPPSGDLESPPAATGIAQRG